MKSAESNDFPQAKANTAYELGGHRLQMEVTMKITGLTHIGICVTDIERSIKFYTEMMGFQITEGPTPPIRDPEDSRGMGFADCITRTCVLRCDAGFSLELVQFLEPEPACLADRLDLIGKHHIAYQVDDIHQWYHKWVEAGLPVYDQPILVNAENEEDSFYWAYVKDPDGITLELNQKVSSLL